MILQSQSSPSYNDNTYSAKYALTYAVCEVKFSKTYHLFKDFVANQHFVIDFGCTLHVSKFVLRNTKNGAVANRGTKEFTLEMSLDNVIWNLVARGALTDVRFTDECQLPEKTFSAFAHGRYVRFTALTYYAMGSGLNYITWEVVAD